MPENSSIFFNEVKLKAIKDGATKILTNSVTGQVKLFRKKGNVNEMCFILPNHEKGEWSLSAWLSVPATDQDLLDSRPVDRG